MAVYARSRGEERSRKRSLLREGRQKKKLADDPQHWGKKGGPINTGGRGKGDTKRPFRQQGISVRKSLPPEKRKQSSRHANPHSRGRGWYLCRGECRSILLLLSAVGELIQELSSPGEEKQSFRS